MLTSMEITFLRVGNRGIFFSSPASQVYYALLMKGNLRSGSRICVHSGHTLSGEAAIAVALSLECFVYTSVDNVSQEEAVKKRFSNVRIETIRALK